MYAPANTVLSSQNCKAAMALNVQSPQRSVDTVQLSHGPQGPDPHLCPPTSSPLLEKGPKPFEPGPSTPCRVRPFNTLIVALELIAQP